MLRLDYSTPLWLEKEIKNVANVIRSGVCEFLKLAAEVPLSSDIEEYDLKEANVALNDLKNKAVSGAKVFFVG